ncbi:MAG: sigma-70 family RNA polymerase sigma factor [Chloroflexi bacterium]|nr:sigma-70 family RNA polymerase sigma factor [Chloroflexota bacterium]
MRHIDYKSLDENTVVELACEGDNQAFGELYERYVTRIYNYFYYRTGSNEDSEDLTARVFIRALKHIENYDNRGVPFSAWLYRIAHNLVANWHRDNSRRKIIPLDDYLVSSLPSDAPDILAESNEQQEELLDAVRSLPEDRQQLLYLKFVERLPNAEIGNIMDRTEGAVKSLYHRTLQALNEDLSTHRAKKPGKRTKR